MKPLKVKDVVIAIVLFVLIMWACAAIVGHAAKGAEPPAEVVPPPLDLSMGASQTVTVDLSGFNGEVGQVILPDDPKVHVYVCGLEYGEQDSVWITCYVRSTVSGREQIGSMSRVVRGPMT